MSCLNSRPRLPPARSRLYQRSPSDGGHPRRSLQMLCLRFSGQPRDATDKKKVYFTPTQSRNGIPRMYVPSVASTTQSRSWLPRPKACLGFRIESRILSCGFSCASTSFCAAPTKNHQTLNPEPWGPGCGTASSQPSTEAAAASLLSVTTMIFINHAVSTVQKLARCQVLACC